MLNYLSLINSPLYDFLYTHPRLRELTSKDPYPKIISYVESLQVYPYTFLGESLMAVSTKMTTLMLKNNLVYALLPAPEKVDRNENDLGSQYYIGSRIAGTNRNVGHIALLRNKENSSLKKINNSSLSPEP